MSPSSPTTEKGRRTRDRIVSAAAELVAEKGAADVSLEDIEERAGVGRSQTYHYFDGRDDLIRAVVDATANRLLDSQSELLDNLDTWEGIERWMDGMVAYQVHCQARGGCPLGSLAGQLAERDPLARTALRHGFDRWEGKIGAGIAEMKARGELRDTADPGRLAQITMALIEGGELLTQVRLDPHQLRSALDGALELLRSYAV